MFASKINDGTWKPLDLRADYAQIPMWSDDGDAGADSLTSSPCDRLLSIACLDSAICLEESGMRTSRVARDTARVVNALSSSTRSREQRSLRSTARPSNPAISAGDLPEQSDSELSTPPSSPNSSWPTDSKVLGKRKRVSDDTKPTNKNVTGTNPATATRSGREASQGNNAARQKRPGRQAAKRVKSEDGNITIEPPSNWEEVYNVTTQMRKRVLAPVDTMGCESLAEKDRSPRDQRLQTLVSLMLSSQTKDTVTAVAMKNLQDHLPGGFCLESLLKVEPTYLNQLIEKVGFHNNKTKFIKSAAEILRDKFDNDIPDTIDGLVSLPGVGPKMAYLCMSAAWGRDEGIGVDVHVHRITNLWRWHKTSTPEQTRAQLEAWLPKEKWHDINHLLVGLGQTICLPVGRKCGDCDLAARNLCPSAVASNGSKKATKKKAEVKVEDGTVVKEEAAAVEIDDTGYAMNVKQEDVGEVELTGTLDRLPDIEGPGAGVVKKMTDRVKKVVH